MRYLSFCLRLLFSNVNTVVLLLSGYLYYVVVIAILLNAKICFDLESTILKYSILYNAIMYVCGYFVALISSFLDVVDRCVGSDHAATGVQPGQVHP